MPHYEYQLLEVYDAGWDKLQDAINQVAKEGFRYRDTIRRSEQRIVLIFERDAAQETGDAWATARAAMNRSKSIPGGRRIQEDERKYPPEDDE